VRQWWLADTAIGFCNTCGGATDKPDVDRIHVIEHSAYSSKCEELERLKYDFENADKYYHERNATVLSLEEQLEAAREEIAELKAHLSRKTQHLSQAAVAASFGDGEGVAAQTMASHFDDLGMRVKHYQDLLEAERAKSAALHEMLRTQEERTGELIGKVAELENAVETFKLSIYEHDKAIKIGHAREQKLVAALEKILSLPTTGPETKIAREALKKHRGEK
jgi:predicted RNase H-like nuclease (RuvC/YqgF family)